MRKTKIIASMAACAVIVGTMSATIASALTTTSPEQKAKGKTFTLISDSASTTSSERTVKFMFENAAYTMLDDVGSDIDFAVLNDGKEVEVKSFTAEFAGYKASDTNTKISSQVTWQSTDSSLKTYQKSLLDGEVSVSTSNSRTYDNAINLSSYASLSDKYTVTVSGVDIAPVSGSWNTATVPVGDDSLDNKFFTSIDITAVIEASADISDDKLASSLYVDTDSFGSLAVKKVSGSATVLAFDGTESSSAKTSISAANQLIASEKTALVNYYNNLSAWKAYTASKLTSISDYINTFTDDAAVAAANITAAETSNAVKYKYLVDSTTVYYQTKADLTLGLQNIVVQKAQALIDYDKEISLQENAADIITNDLQAVPYYVKGSTTPTTAFTVTSSDTEISEATVESIDDFVNGTEDSVWNFSLTNTTAETSRTRLGIAMTVSRVKNNTISTVTYSKDNLYASNNGFNFDWNDLTDNELDGIIYTIEKINLYSVNNTVSLANLTINVPEKDKLNSSANVNVISAGAANEDTATAISAETSQTTLPETTADESTTASSSNPKTGNSPVALAVIPAALAAGFIISKSLKK